jgi:hypothetical protein
VSVEPSNQVKEVEIEMNNAMRSTIGTVALGLILTVSGGVAIADAQFSAEMVQRGPEGEMSSGRMFVGEKRVRVEMAHQGRDLVRVTDENRGMEWMLFPDQKKYMEQKLGGQGGDSRGGGLKPAQDPCGGMPGLSCNKLGEEEVGGRTAVKWEVEASHQGQSVKSTQWIDKERGVPLRQEMPNGQVTDLKFIAEEDLDGRKVEKWEMVSTMPNRPETRTFQWFDPELGLAIRQEFPGGIVSELRNIRVGEQPDELFNVPAGYERMPIPQAMQPGSDPASANQGAPADSSSQGTATGR